MRDKIFSACMWTGMILILVGIFIPFFTGPHETYYKYIFAAGAAINLIGRIFTRYNGKNIRVKRLLRIETWASLFFCVSVYFMFADPDPRNWIVFVLAGGALMAYTSLMLPKVQKSDSRN